MFTRTLGGAIATAGTTDGAGRVALASPGAVTHAVAAAAAGRLRIALAVGILVFRDHEALAFAAHLLGLASHIPNPIPA